MRVREILAVLESVAPARYAFSYDKVGLQVGDPDAEVARAVVSLDRSRAAVAFAREAGAGLLLAHHPLLFSPLKEVLADDHVGRTVLDLAASGIAFAAAHTNWDAAMGGVNDALAERLGLEGVQAFGSGADATWLKVVFTVPEDHADAVIDAAAKAGAGKIRNYERCAFLGAGTGTFVGDGTANPFVGRPETRESVPEVRVEMSVPRERQRAVEGAILRAHPYEVPVIDSYSLAPINEQPAGRVGMLPEPTSLRDFVARIDAALDTRALAWGAPTRPIQKVAVVGGAADGEWRAAQRAGADVLVTGEVKQHVALEASESDFALVAAGHYATEQPGVEALRKRMAEVCPAVEWRVFAPEPGAAGRPL